MYEFSKCVFGTLKCYGDTIQKQGRSLRKLDRRITFLGIITAACVYKLNEQNKKIDTLTEELERMKGE